MKWLSWSNVVLGIWLIVAPFTLRYSAVHGAMVDDVLLGMVIAAFAAWRAMGPETAGMRTVSWLVTVAGLWTMCAPFMLGYSSVPAAMANDVTVGLMVVILGMTRAMAPSRPAGVW
jgi:hypothetical protein